MFTPFDVLVSVIILVSIIVSFLRGFIKDLLSIFGYVGAAIITLYFFPYAVSIAQEHFKDSTVVNFVTVICLYLLVLTVIFIINATILKSLIAFRTGAVDRSLGLLFGFVKGLAIVSLIHYSVSLVAEDEPEWLTEGETYSLTQTGADIVGDIAGDYIKALKEQAEEGEYFSDEIEGLEDGIDDTEDMIDEGIEDTEEYIEGVVE